jgi:natural resistance-associated macrophage protein 2
VQGVALVGSLIMPHNIYLHSALVQTRRLEAACDAEKRDALRYIKIESALSLGVRPSPDRAVLSGAVLCLTPC